MTPLQRQVNYRLTLAELYGKVSQDKVTLSSPELKQPMLDLIQVTIEFVELRIKKLRAEMN